MDRVQGLEQLGGDVVGSILVPNDRYPLPSLRPGQHPHRPQSATVVSKNIVAG